MKIHRLFEENPWWKNKEAIEKDYDIAKWKEKKHKWVPDIIEKIKLEPFALHIITGARQVGKTTILKLLIKKLLHKRNPKSIFFFNCEDVSDFKELSEILETYLEIKETNSIKNSILILDEITSPKEWYRTIKSFIDKGKFRNDILIITGSTSMSIKREVELFPGRRGKGKDFTIYPLSFRSFLKIIDPELAKKIPCFDKLEQIEKKALNALIFEKELNKHLHTYMKFGGFPLSITNFNKEEAKRAYLSWIKNAVFKSDRSDIIARQIIKVLIETAGSDISWENISKKIEIKSPKTVAAYVDLLNSIFAANILYNLDLSGKKIKFGKNKKIHFRDPLLFEIFEDWCLTKIKKKKPIISEALVIEHLNRKFPENVFFWKGKFEIDAIVLEKEYLYGFEVKWRERPKTRRLNKSLNQLKKFIIITKKDYSKKPLKIPLSVFLCLFDV